MTHGGYRKGGGRPRSGRYGYTIRVTDSEREAVKAFILELRMTAPSFVDVLAAQGVKLITDGDSIVIDEGVLGWRDLNRLAKLKPEILAYLQSQQIAAQRPV